jgi:putative endonuclease
LRAKQSNPLRRESEAMKQPCVYIMASGRNGTLYTGVTSNLSQRTHQHREGFLKGFTKQYNCKYLVWFEQYELIVDAIAREKQIKAGSRAKKIALIAGVNPEWRDLYDTLAL